MSVLQAVGLPDGRVREFGALLSGVQKRVLLRYCLLVARNIPAIVRKRSLSPVQGAMPKIDARFHFFGTEFVLGLDLFSGVRELYCRRVYNFLPSFEIRPNDVCVDLGANVGLFSLQAAKLGRRVVSVEAQSGFIPLFRENMRKNGCLHKVDVFHAIIGDSSGLFASEENRQKASHFDDMPDAIQMSEILERCGGSIDFLKMDVEGSEFGILSGDTTWLDSVKRIAMEVHPKFGDASQLLEVLHKHGFHTLSTNSEQQLVTDPSKIDYLYASREQPLSL